MRHICTPGDQIIKNNFAHETICQMQHFNPIQSKWVVAIQIASVQLLQQSIPFGIAVLYTLVQKHLTFVALKARKTSSLHTILF